ncbi:MAG: VWA domain-containing protein [Promethearchaeota archaeon]
MVDGLPIEDVVILLDTSRSILRRDFKPSRLRVVVRSLVDFIPRKFMIDPNDRISIVTFGEKAHKLHDFSGDKESLIDSLSKIEISEKSDVCDGLALSMQMLATEIRKIGGKVVRIILFSDDRLGIMSDRLIKLTNAAKGLGIFIDSLVVGEAPRPSTNTSVLKKLSLMTGGDYAFFKNEQAFLKAAVGLSSKKDLNDLSGYWASQEKEMNSAPLLAEIAVDLRRPEINEIQEMIAEPNKIKCNICYKANDGHGAPYATIRFCPSCGRPMHLSCSSEWAKNSSNGSGDVFRCPFCYFLLRVPASFKVVSQAKSSSKDEKSARFSLVPKEDIESIDSSCGNCHVIFLGEYDVYKCGNCGTYYHKPCVKEIQEKYHACRICGSTISNIHEIA